MLTDKFSTILCVFAGCTICLRFSIRMFFLYLLTYSYNWGSISPKYFLFALQIAKNLHIFFSSTFPFRCRNLTFPESLPEVSIVFIFVNEALSVILRSIHSAIDRTPAHLLKEIILVDDNSNNGKRFWFFPFPALRLDHTRETLNSGSCLSFGLSNVIGGFSPFFIPHFCWAVLYSTQVGHV